MSSVRPVKVSPAAATDIEEIADYIAQDRPAAAARVLTAISEMLDLLARHPELGRERPEIKPGYRSIVVRRYVIFYRVTTAAVEVLRVLDGSRDIDHAFLTDRS